MSSWQMTHNRSSIWSFFYDFVFYVICFPGIGPQHRFLLWASSKFAQLRGSTIGLGIIRDFGSSNIYQDNDDYLTCLSPPSASALGSI